MTETETVPPTRAKLRAMSFILKTIWTTQENDWETLTLAENKIVQRTLYVEQEPEQQR